MCLIGRPRPASTTPSSAEKSAPSAASDLLSCPMGVAVRVSRVIDQDAQFLHFVEASGLKPGEELIVESRDEAADRVGLRHTDGRVTTIGARAAAKILASTI